MKIEQHSSIAATQSIDTASTSSSAAASVDAPSLLPEVSQLACSGDPGAMLAALSMQTAKAEHDTSRTMRDNAMSAQEKAEAAEVADMHGKADLQRAQGFFDGAMQIAQGACDLGAGVADAHAASESAEAQKEQADIKENGDSYSKDHVEALQTSVDTLKSGAKASDSESKLAHGASSGFSCVKAVGDGLFSGEMTDKDADAKMHDASAQTFKQIADDANDSMKDAKDLMTKALDFYKEYVDTKNQTTMAAIHRA